MRRTIVIVLVIGLLLSSNCSALPFQRDEDEAGLTYCRDDDGTEEGSYVLDSNPDWIKKKLWVYYDDYYNCDEIRLYVYGKLSEQRDTNNPWSHKIIIDGEDRILFRASDHFNRHAFIWTYFVIDKEYIFPNSCVEVKIGEKTNAVGKEHLAIGIDRTFSLLQDTNPNPPQDFQRSWTDQSVVQDSLEPWKEFEGEFMVYFEFVSISPLSLGHMGMANGFIPIEEDIDGFGDSCGIEFDWTSLTTNEYNRIYKVRLIINGRASGNTDLNVPKNIEIRVNDAQGINGHVITFNPYERFNDNEFYRSAFEIHNVHDKSNWLVPGMNRVQIYETDNDPAKNNLDIATQEGDSQDTWWYYWDENKNPPNWNGLHDSPTYFECDMDLQIYIEVYRSNIMTERRSLLLYELGIIHLNALFFGSPESMLSDDGINDMKNDFLTNGYSLNFDYRNDQPTQWTVYGERRSKYDIGGDTVDFLVLNSHGGPEYFVLYHGVKKDLGGQSAFKDSIHSNDDRIDFSTIDGLTEAEGNDEAMIRGYPRNYFENIGSDGFDLDTEWVLFNGCSVLQGHDEQYAPDNTFQTLLWHGLHAIFGISSFGNPEPLDDLLKEFFDECWGLNGQSPKPVLEAYRDACEDAGLPNWVIYFHQGNENDYLWGCPGTNGVTPDIYTRDDLNINYKDMEG